METENQKRWFGLVGGDEGLEKALINLTLEAERARAGGRHVPKELQDETELYCLAHSVLFSKHSIAELATLALKMASRVDCDECDDCPELEL